MDAIKNDFVNSADYDNLVNALKNIVTSGSNNAITELDQQIETIKSEIDNVNYQRQQMTSICRAVYSVIEHFKQKNPYQNELLNNLILFLLNEYHSSLKNEIQDSKPEELLRKKGNYLREKEALQRRATMAQTILKHI